jgi:dephospho-CoA kinase
MSNPIQIGITGGIGSGKSIISKILRIMQYPVYDTDAQAKTLMDTPTLRQALMDQWGKEIIQPDGQINRAHLAQIVFNNPQQLTILNNIVHPAVRNHYAQWVQQQQSPIVFVESAILHQAHMDNTLEHIWLVKADDETRIQRVIQRNNTTRQDVEARIATQYDPPIDHRTHIITNNNNDAILPQIMKHLNNILT